MAWRLTGDKPLSEPMMAYFIDACIRHSDSMGQLKRDNFLKIMPEDGDTKYSREPL